MLPIPTSPVSIPTVAARRDVQVAEIGPGSQVLRSRTWERLKFEVEYGRQCGTTANSYLIRGDRSTVIDPPGESFTAIYLEALQQQLDLSTLGYIIISHINANRLTTLMRLHQLAPQAQIVCSRPAARWLQAEADLGSAALHPVRSGDTLALGQGQPLQFLGVPTPRWPDGLCTYDPASQILYSDKLFGAHLCADALWDEQWRQLEADRRHYFDCLHGSHAKQVAAALSQIQPLPLKTIAPGHGPMVRYSLSRVVQDYGQWCQQQRQRSRRVALLYASAYGSTAQMAEAIAHSLTAAEVAVEMVNCEQADPTALLDTLARCDGVIIGSPTLGGHAPVQVQTVLGLVLANLPKTKLVGVFGSYGWSGEAIDWLEQKLRDANFRFGFEPLRVRFSPDQRALDSCAAVATEFARQLRKRQQQESQLAGVEVQGDRTTQALGRIVGSLCVLTAQAEGAHVGLLTASVTQASFSPPGLMVALPQGALGPEPLSSGKPFVLNILQEGRAVRRHFSPRQGSSAPFDHLPFTVADNHCAVLSDALAHLECTVSESLTVGNRTLIYATVQRGDLMATGGVPALGQ